MSTASIDRLRKLQAGINASIDGYIDTATHDASNKGKVAVLQSQIIDQAAQIRGETKSTTDRILELCWGPAIPVAVRSAIDLDLFAMIPGQGVGLDELVRRTGAGRNMVLRILRMLAASHIIIETGEYQYAATELSKALTVKECRDCFKMSFDYMHPIISAAPAFLKKTNYQDQDQNSNVCHDFHGTNFFEYLAEVPERMATFQSAMAIQETFPPETIPQYPFEESFRDISSDSIHIIDVGGGRGFALRDLLARYPDMPGRLMLQDYESVIEDTKTSALPERIEFMPHDASQPQPVHGAKYYYYRRVFHTWPDTFAVQALKALHGAMKKGYSKLLIQDEVIKDVGCDAQRAIQDLNMMIVASMERSEGQWRALLKEGGFEITKIVRAEVGVLGIVEAELVD